MMMSCLSHARAARPSLLAVAALAALASTAVRPAQLTAQSVCLPLPRLLTTTPMGGQIGTEVEVTISGQNLDDVEQLLFSDPRLAARPKLNSDGTPEANRFIVAIAADCPPGVHEARVMTRLGISSPRAFSVSALPEVTQEKPSASLAEAFPLEVNTVCNATLPVRAVNHYTFQAKTGQRILVDCAARGIDSKMNPVLVVGDAAGRDLAVERRGGALDFVAPSDGTYTVKVHDLTFQGGPECFYRLVLRELAADAVAVRLPGTRAVSAFSWPPVGLPETPSSAEVEPNDQQSSAQKITLPCDIAGRFYPAADVDTYQFEARKGEVWWIEVASERLGRDTDPSVIVQRVTGQGDDIQVSDVAELSDILSPVKRSSNGYSYDGPPYNAGSTDVLGKVEIPEDGVYRLQIMDLFGGTRSEPRNEYRLVVRQAQPDFALVAWALHMELRNGDRNALSKPMALRGGSTVALEVVAVRRDGFDGEIELSMDNLPEGVTATGLKIPAGAARGVMLVTAREDAPRGMRHALFVGRSTIEGQQVTRPCQLATMAWPVTNAWAEIPAPRLVADVPISVSSAELAPVSLAPAENKVWEAVAGQPLKIPLSHVRRDEFSGNILALRTFGAGFEGNPRFEVSLAAEQSEAVIDLAKLKPSPGEYTIAFYGSAVAKYQATPEAKPTDVAEIVVTEPVTIRIQPAETK